MRELKRFAWFAVALVLVFAGSATAGDLANANFVFDFDTDGEDAGEFKTFDGQTSLTGQTFASGDRIEVELFLVPTVANPAPADPAAATQLAGSNIVAVRGSLIVDKSIVVINRFRWEGTGSLEDDGFVVPTGQVIGAPLLTPTDPESQILLTFFRNTDDGQATGHPLPYGYLGTMRLEFQADVTGEVALSWDNLSVTSTADADTEPTEDIVGAAVPPALAASEAQVELGGSATVSVTKYVSAISINGTADNSAISWTVAKTGNADVVVTGQTESSFTTALTEPTITLTSSGSGAASVEVSATVGGVTIAATTVVFEEATPVELASFGGEAGDQGIVLNWTTGSQTNNAGWRILRSEDGENYAAVGAFVQGAGTTEELLNYTFTDEGLAQSETVFYVLEQLDLDGSIHLSSPIEILLGARFQDIPQDFSISAYPNPFNPSTTVSYDLPSAELVNIVIYDVLGQEVRRLVDDQKTPGRYSIRWDARDNSGRSVGSGVYIAKIEAGTFSQAQKMLLLK